MKYRVYAQSRSDDDDRELLGEVDSEGKDANQVSEEIAEIKMSNLDKARFSDGMQFLTCDESSEHFPTPATLH